MPDVELHLSGTQLVLAELAKPAKKFGILHFPL